MAKEPAKIHTSERRAKILDSLDLPIEEMPIPRWDTTVVVRGMPMAHPRFVSYVEGRPAKGQEPPGPREAQIRRNVAAVILCTFDPDTDEQMFNWSDADDLRLKHYNTVLLISAKAFTLAGGDGPLEMKGIEAVDYLTAYGIEEDWTPEDMAHIGALRALVEEKITDEAEPDEETPEDRSDSPLEEPTPA